jgi:hypothetical protein
MATPAVGGCVMLIADACPCIARDVAKIQSFLQNTALQLQSGTQKCGTDTVSNVPNNIFGYGSVNVYEAIVKCREYCEKH